jgi:hypothetical protein
MKLFRHRFVDFIVRKPFRHIGLHVTALPVPFSAFKVLLVLLIYFERISVGLLELIITSLHISVKPAVGWPLKSKPVFESMQLYQFSMLLVYQGTALQSKSLYLRIYINTIPIL